MVEANFNETLIPATNHFSFPLSKSCSLKNEKYVDQVNKDRCLTLINRLEY